MLAKAANVPAGHIPGSMRKLSVTPVSWTPSKELDVAAWLRVGHRLGVITRCSQWWLGDWIRYGTARWGEKYKEAARITGYDVHTLRNIAYVAGQIEASRRRDDLTWSHHAEVCALPPEEQDKWLDLASEQRMSVADLRIELRQVRREDESMALPSKEKRMVSCPECEHRFPVPRL